MAVYSKVKFDRGGGEKRFSSISSIAGSGWWTVIEDDVTVTRPISRFPSPPLDPVLALIPLDESSSRRAFVHYSFTCRVHRIRIREYEKRSEIFEREPKTADDDRTEKKSLTGPFVSPAKLDLSKF